MTESEWLACADPKPMLRSLGGKFSDRKRRLFGVACCRRIWRLLGDERSRSAVENAELQADEIVNEALLEQVNTLAAVAAQEMSSGQVGFCSYAGWAAERVSRFSRMQASDLEELIENAAWAPASEFAVHVGDSLVPANLTRGARKATRKIYRAELVRIADVLRCIVRPTLAQSTPVDPTWQTWNDGGVRKMAQVIYNGRAFDRLPLLADALEEAGCIDAAILGHCRGGGEHVRGCWVVDLLLGKK